MFLSGACADNILKTVLPDVTLSSMGLMDLNNGILLLIDRITNNIAPLVEMKAEEVELALHHFLPENLIEAAKTAANAAVQKFTSSGAKIEKCEEKDFPLDDLLSRLREKYHSVRINENTVVYMASCIETAVAELLKACGEKAMTQNRKQISRMDVKWVLANNFEIAPFFT
ncbi:hypothetical protein TRFO_14300 [Tritrichomonas foetus]|uniref:Uncharacterized protein n=1 Tax=Tritrichomonas foetus TaxID=1144522 RepID=A0A1J4KWJ8_9EUKA|nr:hypothetical protein TRFO_14300 [Tritrichomonas foetus]|eukprot:OHT15256.1 hypothetical protein TRFO_14300 [Tritrichomonas foetus]